MSVISASRGNPQASDIAVQTATPMLGGASREDLQTVISSVDAEIAKLFEDRNIQLVDGGTLTYTAGAPSQLSMSASLKLVINSQVAGGAPTVIDLAATTRDFSADGRMLYAVINRSAGTAVVTADSATLPAVTSANQEVVLIAKRFDGATQRVYLRNGQSFGNGESAVLGAAAVIPSFSDAAFEIFDDATPTKIIKFQASGLTGTNTFTPPPATDTLAGLGTAQTFSAINTFSAQMKISDGSVTEPSIVFTSDDDATGTGIYRVAANSLGFAANGVNVGQYSSAGAWTLGTDSVSTSHTFNVGLSSRSIKMGPGDSNRPGLAVDNSGASIALALAGGGGNPVLSYAGGALNFINNTYATVSSNVSFGLSGTPLVVGAVSTAGAWTLGPVASSPTVVHTIYGLGLWIIGSSGSQHIMKTDTNASTAVTMWEWQRNNGGNCGEIVINAAAQTTSYSTSSDSRLKEDQGDFSGLSLVMQSVPRKYKWTAAPELGAEVGFYAQEMFDVAPWSVVSREESDTKPWSMDYGKLTAIAFKAIQELKQQIDAIKAEYDAYVAAHP